jgi:sensor histidine kinase YesM
MKRILYHLFFWVLSYLLFTQATAIGSVGYVDWVYSGVWFFIFMSFFYISYFATVLLFDDLEDEEKILHRVYGKPNVWGNFRWKRAGNKDHPDTIRFLWLFRMKHKSFVVFTFGLLMLNVLIQMTRYSSGIFNTIVSTRVFPSDVFLVDTTNGTTRLIYFIIFFVLALTFVLFERQERQKKVREELEQEKRLRAEAENRTILQQVNPHFLYNSLNAIYSQAVEGKDTVKESILLLSEMMRYPLSVSNQKMVSLQEELKQIQRYLELQKLRFGSRVLIRFKNQLSEEAQQALVSPLLLMIPIENAFKHGHLKIASLLDIRFYEEKDQIVLWVENPVSKVAQSLVKSPSTGQGLLQLEEGLDFAYGKGKYKLRYGPTTSGSSYSFELKIPLHIKEKA